jgi:pyruvate,water dikinase
VTNRGGRTCHAAIVARELGIPAVVGCVDATSRIKNNKMITVSCADGQTGYVYEGELDYKIEKIPVLDMPKLPLNICVNMGNPERAFSTRFLPNKGVGLARLEFIISQMIGVHPNACLNYETLPKKLKEQVRVKTSAYANPVEYYIAKLSEGISMLAAAFDPQPVIFRFSDFKSNEYMNLLGGSLYEPHEENPMIGFRGASRYVHATFREAFAMECTAFKRVREKMGLTNAQIMIPFVRTVAELKQVIELMAEYGLKRGENNLKVYMMCEVPSNALLAEEFLEHVDGYSIGSNDLTQLVLGLDRDSSIVANLFDERNLAVKKLLNYVITVCNKRGKYIGICGQAPSDYPEFAEWLMAMGIKNISLNPDSIVSTWLRLAAKNSIDNPSLS